MLAVLCMTMVDIIPMQGFYDVSQDDVFLLESLQQVGFLLWDTTVCVCVRSVFGRRFATAGMGHEALVLLSSSKKHTNSSKVAEAAIRWVSNDMDLRGPQLSLQRDLSVGKEAIVAGEGGAGRRWAAHAHHKRCGRVRGRCGILCNGYDKL